MKRASEKKYTTVQISKKVREVLRSLARAKRRSMTKQIEWLILQEAQRQSVVSKIVMRSEEMAKYKNIPVDEETAVMLAELCEAYEFGQRGQGAMVKKLAKAEWLTLKEAKLLPSQNRKRAAVVKIVAKLESKPVAETTE